MLGCILESGLRLGKQLRQGRPRAESEIIHTRALTSNIMCDLIGKQGHQCECSPAVTFKRALGASGDQTKMRQT
jgi:hypothetical protein